MFVPFQSAKLQCLLPYDLQPSSYAGEKTNTEYRWTHLMGQMYHGSMNHPAERSFFELPRTFIQYDVHRSPTTFLSVSLPFALMTQVQLTPRTTTAKIPSTFQI